MTKAKYINEEHDTNIGKVIELARNVLLSMFKEDLLSFSKIIHVMKLHINYIVI